MSDPRRKLGLHGERLAEAFLKRNGLRTVTRRFDTPVGELDLVMRDRDTVVFVEVKTLRDDTLIDPHEHLGRTQQRRIARAARWFLERQRWMNRPCRFDLVGVLLPEAGEPRIQHYPEAFEPPAKW